MRKLFALTTLAALLPLGATAADVTVYGKVNTSIYYEDYSGQAPKVSLANEGSRFGINVREDLTTDVSIKAYLENGFNIDDGGLTNTGGGNSGATLFDRRSILAVHSKTWGEVGFGRMGSVRSTMAPYALSLAWLDPMETNYGDAGMSAMFGNDPRGNNSVTYVSPNLNGFRFGSTYSFAFTDQESDHVDKNNRLLALAASYATGPVAFYAGGTHIWYGRDDASGQADKGKSIEREDASAFDFGMTLQATDDLKLFAAGQYQKDWRSSAGWNVDKASTYASDAYTAADRRRGIDGWTGLVGMQLKLSGDMRLIGKYVYFEGEHVMGDGSKVKGQRHSVNGALEKKLSKRTKLYGVLSYFKGCEELDVGTLTGVTGHFGLEHNF